MRHAPTVEGHEPDAPTSIVEGDLIDVVDQLETALSKERDNVELCDDYYFGKHPHPYMPKEASAEYRQLAERAVTNVVPLVIQNLAQLLYVEGYLPEGSSDNAQAWSAWQANRMDFRQSALFRSALKYGVAYTVIGYGGKYPTIRGVSPRNMITLYEDPANDEWPAYALERVSKKSNRMTYRVYTDSEIITLEKTTNRKNLNILSTEYHGYEYVPIVRFTPDLDLEGRYEGEIRKITTAQDRLNQTVMDRLLVQTFGSWKLRTISGMALPDDTGEAAMKKMQIAKDRMLVADDPDTKFGSLPETSLSPFITATHSDSESLAALASIPPHYLTGTLNNLGAEAIAEARASLEAKATEVKHAFGEHVEQVMRACSYFMGDERGANDYNAQVVWRDAQNRSLSQVADALGKIATMLQVPVEALWDRLPGVTQGDVERWKQLREEQSLDLFMQQAQDAMNAEGEDVQGNVANDQQPPSGG